MLKNKILDGKRNFDSRHSKNDSINLWSKFNNVIIIMLRIELITNVKLEHKIDFKLFFFSKTACVNTNLLEQ